MVTAVVLQFIINGGFILKTSFSGLFHYICGSLFSNNLGKLKTTFRYMKCLNPRLMYKFINISNNTLYYNKAARPKSQFKDLDLDV